MRDHLLVYSVANDITQTANKTLKTNWSPYCKGTFILHLGETPCRFSLFFFFITSHLDVGSRDSSVGIALGYGLDDRGSRVRFPAGAGNFSLHHRIQNGAGVHPASYPMGTRGSFPGVKRPGREADHSPSSRAEVKNAWSYTSTPQYVFMAWCLVKHRDNFTFTFTHLEVHRVRYFRRHTECIYGRKFWRSLASIFK
jgi:hypothetical protein